MTYVMSIDFHIGRIVDSSQHSEAHKFVRFAYRGIIDILRFNRKFTR